MELTRRQWLLGLVAALVGAFAVASYRAERATDRLVRDLRAAADTTAAEPVTVDDLHDLPEPVRHYFETVLPDDHRPVRTARLEQEGRIQMDEGDDGWKPFTATQHVTVDPPGFVWDATVEMAPFVDGRVVDAYHDGAGTLRATAFGLPVMSADPGPELDEGELLRYLAEAVWVPTALLPSAGVEWTAVDADSARATLTDGDVRATLTFRFGEDDLVREVSGRRYREETGDEAAWAGRFDAYERHDGFLVPTEGEVAWRLPEGDVSYWRGTVTAFDYDTGRSRPRTERREPLPGA
jgi:hypothetical protein